MYASRFDPRISYCLYVPERYAARDDGPEMVAVIHGSPRTFMDFRNRLGDFAEEHNVIVVSPLFPVGLGDDLKGDDYKYLSKGSIRYDLALVEIVEEVRARYSVAARRFGLFGFSGGAQFVNRVLLLQPESLWAASLGAPGSVTLIDDENDWWVGTRDVEALFGRPLNLQAIRDVPVQLLVGSEDLETEEITHLEGGRHWMATANSAGASRPARLETLRASLTRAGVHLTHEVMQGVGHDPVPTIERAKHFLAAQLKNHRLAAQVR